MDSVRVVVAHAGKTLQSLPFTLRDGPSSLPIDVGLLSSSGGGADVEVDVSGFLGSTFVVSQDAVTSFVRGESLLLEMFLAADCVAFQCPDPNQTCTKGQVCISKTRIPSALPAFEAHPPDAAPSEAGDARDDAPADGAGGTAGGAAGGTGTAGASAPDASVEAPADAPRDRAAESTLEVAPDCVPVPENCFNGIDDDCDGLSDCADPDCVPIAACVPRPSGNVGTIVGATDACPKGFAALNDNATPFGLTIDPGGVACNGCQCAQVTSKTSCAATITTYTSTADCQAATNGKNVLTISTTSTDPCPVPDTGATNVFGAALSAWTVTSADCGPTGTPIRPMASFAASTGFCPAATLAPPTLDSGCAAGSVCMRRPPAGDAMCVLLADASACPAGTKGGGVLYAGLTDARTCAPCSCSVAGASCDKLDVQMGSAGGCSLETAADGGRLGPRLPPRGHAHRRRLPADERALGGCHSDGGPGVVLRTLIGPAAVWTSARRAAKVTSGRGGRG
jgi:hypothetical protein